MVLKKLIVLFIIVFIINCTENESVNSLKQINNQIIGLSNETTRLIIEHDKLKKQYNYLKDINSNLILLEKEIKYMYKAYGLIK